MRTGESSSRPGEMRKVFALSLACGCSVTAVFLAWTGKSKEPADADQRSPAAVEHGDGLATNTSQRVASAASDIEPRRQSEASALSAVPPMLIPDAGTGWAVADWFEDQLAGDPIDQAWAPATEHAIVSTLPDIETSVISVQAHCRSTICRVEVIYNESRDIPIADSGHRSFISVLWPLVGYDERLSGISATHRTYRSDRLVPVNRPRDDRMVTKVWLGYLHSKEKRPPPPEVLFGIAQ